MAYRRNNPYVHPDPDKGMLNQVGNDGYSFDERDDPDEPVEVVRAPRRLPDAPSAEGPTDAEKVYASLSVEEAVRLSDEEISEMARQAQEDAQDRHMGF